MLQKSYSRPILGLTQLSIAVGEAKGFAHAAIKMENANMHQRFYGCAYLKSAEKNLPVKLVLNLNPSQIS
jgi:hypothetical protein